MNFCQGSEIGLQENIHGELRRRKNRDAKGVGFASPSVADKGVWVGERDVVIRKVARRRCYLFIC